jgi:hypothetical protein
MRICKLSWLIREASQRARERLLVIEHLVLLCRELSTVEYDFLYDKSRRLLAIGYNVTERRRDPSFYDLLASESRLASFVAIAQGHVGTGALVRTRATADDIERSSDAPLMERFDVRVPDAVAGDANV